MGDHFRQYLRCWEARFGGLKKEQNNIIRAISILILSMGVFFYPNSTKTSVAEKTRTKQEIPLAKIIPEKRLGTFTYVATETARKKEPEFCADKKTQKPSVKLDEKEVRTLVAGHPIVEMAPYISKRDKEVASFLVAIAKKESNWGKRSPVKAGQDCYNYWGYRGKENTTDSGYSCFESPEHAVKVVGDRIEKLIYQKVNTPAKMVVWKCGRDCETAGGQAAANKWISDVALYYGKLNS